MRVKIKDLEPLHRPETSRPRPKLEKLSDEELLEAANNPNNGERMSISKKTGRLIQGNGRAYELKKRAADPKSRITEDTEVSVDVEDSLDDWLFPDD